LRQTEILRQNLENIEHPIVDIRVKSGNLKTAYKENVLGRRKCSVVKYLVTWRQ
jgi:hypothetical protein